LESSYWSRSSSEEVVAVSKVGAERGWWVEGGRKETRNFPPNRLPSVQKFIILSLTPSIFYLI